MIGHINYCLNWISAAMQLPEFEQPPPTPPEPSSPVVVQPAPQSEFIISSSAPPVPKTKLKTIFQHKRINHFKNLLAEKNISVSTEVMDRVLGNFQAVDDHPYPHTHKETERKNFLSMSYVARKLFELEELPEIADKFRFNTLSAIQRNDKVWKKICSALKWKYKPSVRAYL
jgi:hypothetical protein